MASMSYKTYVVVWLAARATARGAAGAAVCLCAARCARPARRAPRPAAGWRARARSRPALGDRRGCSAACGRRGRAPPPRLRRQAPPADARFARDRSVRKIKKRTNQETRAQNRPLPFPGACPMLEIARIAISPCESPVRHVGQGYRKSRPTGRLFPYLDTIRGINRRRPTLKWSIPKLRYRLIMRFFAKSPENMTKPLVIQWSTCYNDNGSNHIANQRLQGGGLFA